MPERDKPITEEAEHPMSLDCKVFIGFLVAFGLVLAMIWVVSLAPSCCGCPQHSP